MFQQSWQPEAPVTGYLDRIGPLDSAGDVAAFNLPEALWPQWFVGEVPLTSGGSVYGQDCYILGYPYGLASPVGGLGGQLPIVKKGIIAGRSDEDGVRSWYIDTQTNPGFSGGPLVFENADQPRAYTIAGIVRGGYSAPMEEPSPDNPNPGRTSAGLSACTDTQHVLDLGLVNRTAAPTS